MDTVLDLAKRHRWRTRNLHDGHPVPPAKRPRRGQRGQDAFSGDADRLDAIVGQFGYIVFEGAGLGWFLVAKTRPPHGKIATIREAGGKVNQLGDREAAGTAPMSALETLAKLIGVYRVVSDEVRLAASERGKLAFERSGLSQRRVQREIARQRDQANRNRARLCSALNSSQTASNGRFAIDLGKSTGGNASFIRDR